MYQNRWFENGEDYGVEINNTRLYRDLTGSWLLGPGGQAESPGANYDNDFHDMDNDSDIDGYLLGYIGTTDNWAVNNGVGNFQNFQTVPSSGNDDNEIDWHDFDHDGDVDPFISAFASSDRFYRNQFIESGSINLTLVAGIASGVGTSTLGSDMGDMDNDHDIDIICAEDGGANEDLMKNNLDTPDPIAPKVTQIMQVASTTPRSKPRHVAGRVWDNVNYEYFKQATGVLNYTVDGVPHTAPAVYHGGTIVQAEIPGYWFGTIAYSMSVTDRRGNTGSSVSKNVVIPAAGFATYGSDSTGCNGPHVLGVNSAPTINNPEFTMTCTGGPASTLGLCLASDSQGTGLDVFGLGLPLWVDLFAATEVYGLDAPVDPSGKALAPAPISNTPALIGKHYFFQFIFADAGCTPMLTTSGGGDLTILP
jgi:hypothetical protein